jgi:hypothetical protein
MTKPLKWWPTDFFTATLDPMISPAVSTMPEWYKEQSPFTKGYKSWNFLNRTRNQNVTIKWCQPFFDAFTSGYAITLPSDIRVERNSTAPEFSWKIDAAIVESHSPNQYDMFNIPEDFYNTIYKFYSGTGIETPKGYSTLFTHPLNRPDLPFYTFSGVVDTDTYEQAVAFPFIIKKDFEGIIPAGTPIAQLLPFKRDNWQLNAGTYDAAEELKKFYRFYGKIYRGYKNLHWVKKTYQ